MEGFRALSSTPAFRISNYTVSGSLLTPAKPTFVMGVVQPIICRILSGVGVGYVATLSLPLHNFPNALFKYIGLFQHLSAHLRKLKN